MKKVISRIGEEKGSIEYGLLIAMIAVIVIGIVIALNVGLFDNLSGAVNKSG